MSNTPIAKTVTCSLAGESSYTSWYIGLFTIKRETNGQTYFVFQNNRFLSSHDKLKDAITYILIQQGWNVVGIDKVAERMLTLALFE